MYSTCSCCRAFGTVLYLGMGSLTPFLEPFPPHQRFALSMETSEDHQSRKGEKQTPHVSSWIPDHQELFNLTRRSIHRTIYLLQINFANYMALHLVDGCLLVLFSFRVGLGSAGACQAVTLATVYVEECFARTD